MSVTSHLRDRGSPIRRFLEHELGNTNTVVSEANAALRAGRSHPPLPSIGNPGLVGTAADILLNAWLDPSTPPARQAVSPSLDGAVIVGESQRALMHRLTIRESPMPAEWHDLARHGLLLAWFVSAHRSGTARRRLADRLRDAPAKFDEYARRLWTPDDEQDLLALAPAAFEDHAFACAADRVVVNPVFELSEQLGGGDADLIVDNTLWDYKSSGQRRVVRREDIWQVTAYLLADIDDRYRLQAVGISALRWRTRHVWPVRRFLAHLGRQSLDAVDVADVRRRLAAVVRRA